MGRVVKIEMIVDADGVVRGINRGGKAVRGFAGDVDHLADRTRRTGRIFDFTFGSLLADAVRMAVSRIDDVIRKSFELGTGVEETSSKFGVVFQDMAREVDTFGRSFAHRAGLTQREFQDFASSSGAIFSGVGADLEQTSEQSIRIMKLASDWASFHNEKIQETFTAIRSVITGESEPGKRFGKFIKEDEVALRALADTGKRSKDELTNLEKVQARLNILYDQSTNEIGDLARTEDSRANTLRRLTAMVREQAEQMSSGLLPTYGLLLDMGERLIEQNTEGTSTFIKFATEGIFTVVEYAIELISTGANLAETLMLISEQMGGVSGDSLGLMRALNDLQAEVDGINRFIQDSYELWLQLSRGILIAREEVARFLGQDANADSMRVRREAIEDEIEAFDELRATQARDAETRKKMAARRREELQELLANLGQFREQAAARQGAINDLLTGMSQKAKDKAAKEAREREFAQREIEIDLMQETTEKRLAEVDLAIDKEIAKWRGRSPEIVAQLEKLRTAMGSAALVDFFEDTDTQDDFKLPKISEDAKLKFQTELKDLFDIDFDMESIETQFELGLLGSIDAVDEAIQTLNEHFDATTDPEKREALALLIALLEQLREGFTRTGSTVLDFKELQEDAFNSLSENIVSAAETFGASLAGEQEAIFNAGVLARQMIADLAAMMAKKYLAMAAGFAVFGQYGKAARAVAAAALFAAIAGGAAASASGLQGRIADRREEAENAPPGSLAAQDRRIQDLRQQQQRAQSQAERDRLQRQIEAAEAERKNMQGGTSRRTDTSGEFYMSQRDVQQSLGRATPLSERAPGTQHMVVSLEHQIVENDLFTLETRLSETRATRNKVGNATG